MKKYFSLLMLLCFCAAAMAEPTAPFALSPPVKPEAELWLEGEDFVETSGGVIQADSGCYGGKFWSLLTKDSGEHTVKYKFRVSADGFYAVQIAGQPVGTVYTSPIRYAIDGGAWTDKATLPSSKTAWGTSRAVRWTALETVGLGRGEHTLEFKIDQRRIQDEFFAYSIDAIALRRESEALPDLRGSQPANVFTAEQPLAFQTDPPLTFGKWQWRVVDWQGNEKLQGLWDAKAGALTLPQLPGGYYRLQLQDKQGQWSRWLPFAKLRTAAKPNPDTPFAIDSAQSWLAAPGYSGNSLQPEGAYELVSDLEALAGFSMVRERLSWRDVNPQPGVYRWEGRYEANADLLSRRGIPVLGMFHDAPQWAREGSGVLPHDLLATYEFCKAAAEKFSGQMTAWEFWNEPELKCFGWELAAAHKAAYLGFKAGDPNVDVLLASNCSVDAPGKFFEVLMESGVGDYMDVFNFHLYESLKQYPVNVEEKRKFLARYGQERKPIWVTENGMRNGGEGNEEPIVPGGSLREHDREQELEQAEQLVKAQILLQSLGIERDFTFVFPPYNERGGGKVWGIFRWDYTVKPAYVALANLISQLGNCRYQGKLDLDGISAFLYAQPDGGQVLVYWAAKDEAAGFTLNGQDAQLELWDFLGGGKTIASQSGSYQLAAGRFPAYLAGLSGLAPTEPPIPKSGPKPPVTTDPETVLRIDLGKGFDASDPKRQLVAKLEGDMGSFTLDIFNFSDKAKTLTLENMGDKYLLLGVPESVTVPAMNKVSVPLKMLVRGNITEIFALKLRSRSGEAVSAPVVIPLSPGGKNLLSAAAAKLISGAEPERWEKNAAGEMKIGYDESEEAVRFDVAFAPYVDHWVYPVFRLRPEENLKGAVGLSFEVKADFADPQETAKVAYVMTVLEDELEVGKGVNFAYRPTNRWQTINIAFAEAAPEGFDPADVLLLRIGMNPNPTQHNLTYWLRNLKVYYQK